MSFHPEIHDVSGDYSIALEKDFETKICVGISLGSALRNTPRECQRSQTGHRVKLSCDAVATDASTNPMGTN